MSPARVALLTSNPVWVRSFLESLEENSSGEAPRFCIPLAISTHPSMRLDHRFRDLGRMLRRRSRITGTSAAVQLLNHLVYKRLASKVGSQSDTSSRVALKRDAAELLGTGREVLATTSINSAEAIEALNSSGCKLGVVVGGDVVTRSSLEALEVALVNVHFSDTAFSRGMPPVFWEVLGGHDSITLTLHELVRKLDAGGAYSRLEVPIQWRPTLAETIAATRLQALEALPRLLNGALPGILDGSLTSKKCDVGPLRTIPTLKQVRRAESVCRSRCG